MSRGRPRLNKQRRVLYIDRDVDSALMDYRRSHDGRFPTNSEAVTHLLRRAVLTELDEGSDRLLAPEIERMVRATVRDELAAWRAEVLPDIREAVRETAARETDDIVRRHTRSLGDRLIGVAVTAGRDAFTARKVGRAILDALLGNKEQAAAVEEDAHLSSRSRYTRPGLEKVSEEG